MEIVFELFSVLQGLICGPGFGGRNKVSFKDIRVIWGGYFGGYGRYLGGTFGGYVEGKCRVC